MFTIKQNIDIKNPIIPQHLLINILNNADLCSKVILLDFDNILIFDFNTKKLIKSIKLTNYMTNLSVNSDGTIAVISNEEPIIYIWDLNNSIEIYKIDIDYASWVPVHTFNNNELLIGCGSVIKHYTFNNLILLQSEISFTIKDEYDITVITSNNLNKIACGTNLGNINIFNNKLILLYTFTIDTNLYIKSLSFKNNILLISSFYCIIYDLNTNTFRYILDEYNEIVWDKRIVLLPCMTKIIGIDKYLNSSDLFVWNMNTCKLIKQIKTSINNYTLTPGGKIICYNKKEQIIFNI